MAVLALDAWDAGFVPRRLAWGLNTYSNVAGGPPFSGSEQIQEMPGTRWRAVMDLSSLERHQWASLAGLLGAMDGQANAVAMPFHGDPGRRGAAAGTILATGAAESKQLAVSGVTGAGISFARGDYVGLGHRVHKVVTAVGHAGGSAVLDVRPPLRRAYSAEPVLLTGLRCLLRLAADGQDTVELEPGMVGSFRSLEFVEPLP